MGVSHPGDAKGAGIDLKTLVPGPSLLRTRLQRVSTREVAIIGISARFPGAPDKDRFWEKLCDGADFVGSFPASRRRDIEPFYEYLKEEEDIALRYSPGAFLEGIDRFDYPFFKLTPKEAGLMDPNHRLFLECAMEALEDAGYGGDRLRGSRTGVFAGFGPDFRACNYKDIIMRLDRSLIPLTVQANIPPMLPARISYFLDLHGPAVCLDTACSSSLYAVHLACASLRSGESELAIAGGVKLNLLPVETDIKIGIESDDGYARPFDDAASGTGIGEGVGVVVLKPLYRAARDGDHVYAVIRGSAAGQDGHSMGITAPNALAQTEVMIRAWEDAGIDPEAIAWIEAHGTGTAIGDPIELDGIARAFRRYTERRQFCAITSLKSNLNHLFECAGIAGLIKAALALEREVIPPTIRFETPNRQVDLSKSPVFVNDRRLVWPRGDSPRLCGINAFGMSGTNCHMVLEEAPAVEDRRERERVSAAAGRPLHVSHSSGVSQQASAGPAPAENSLHLLTLSARTPDQLSRLVDEYVRFLERSPRVRLDDLCFTANIGRGHYGCRLALVVGDLEDLALRLKGVLQQGLEAFEIGRAGAEGLGATPVSDHPGPEWALFGRHQVVSAGGRELREGEISEEARERLTGEAAELVLMLGEEYAVASLQALAWRYTQGAEVPWSRFYEGKSFRRVPLPTYPFAPLRCWVEPAPKEAEVYAQNQAVFYETLWIEEPLAAPPASAPGVSNGTALILARKDQAEFSGAVAGRLRALGYEVVCATVRTAAEAEAFCDRVVLRDITHIIHLQTLRLEPSEESLDLTKEYGVWSVLHLLQTFYKRGHESFTLALVTDFSAEVEGREAVIKPENAILVGMGKVAGKELDQVRCFALDIDEEAGAEAVVEELFSGSDVYLRAYRGGRRWVKRFQAVALDRRSREALFLRREGVYLVTGGTGGIGLALAEYLARQAPVSFALLSRHGLPDPALWDRIDAAGVDPRLIARIHGVKRLRSLGSEVVLPAVDVTDAETMAGMIRDLRARFGRINGIIHGAGIAPEHLLLNRAQAAFAAVLAPKVEGTRLLDRLTLEDQPDFMVLCSSVASVFPALGQVDYSAANSYLDAYARYRSRTGLRTMALNWVAWKEVGMAVDTGSNLDSIFRAISTERAVEAFREALETGLIGAVVGALNFDDRIVHQLEKQAIRLSDPIRKRLEGSGGGRRAGVRETAGSSGNMAVTLTGRRDGGYTPTEQAVASIWGDVLGFRELDVYANFYDLGGDSVLALRIANAVNQRFDIELKLSDLMKYQTLAGVCEKLDRDYLPEPGDSPEESIPAGNGGPSGQGIPPEEGNPPGTGLPAGNGSPSEQGKPSEGGILQECAIPRAAPAEAYPLSSQQARLYTLYTLEPESTVYNMPVVYTVDGKIDRARFETVARTLVSRHESLRTFFVEQDGLVRQKITDSAEIPIEYLELPEKEVDSAIRALVRPFDLSVAPLARIALIAAGPDRHYVWFDAHHIISDGSSILLLMNDFFSIYAGVTPRALPLAYKDYAVWQQTLHRAGGLEAHARYWLAQFAEGVPVLDLPVDYPRSGVPSAQGASVTVLLERALRDGLLRLARRQETTLFATLLAIFSTLLAKYANQYPLVVGTPVSGRTKKELEGIAGLFVNTLPLLLNPDPDKSFVTYLGEVRHRVLDALDHQDYQLEQLVQSLEIAPSTERNPLFDVLFALRAQRADPLEVVMDGFAVSAAPVDIPVAKFDLQLEAFEQEDGLGLTFVYRTCLFKPESVQGMARDFGCIVRAVLEAPEKRLRDIPLEGRAVRRLGMPEGLDELELDM